MWFALPEVDAVCVLRFRSCTWLPPSGPSTGNVGAQKQRTFVRPSRVFRPEPQRAQEIQQADPKVAYYCRLYAVEQVRTG